MTDNTNIEFKKSFSQYKKARTIKECFHHNKKECKGKIKQSHSLQRNGRLSIIEEPIGNNNMLYTFTSFDVGSSRFIDKLTPIGKSNASTFFGFCDYHDTTLFSEIERNKFVNNDKHCFLHSYRSFAHSYHLKKEEKQGITTQNPLSDNMPSRDKDLWEEGATMALNDLATYKEKLDTWIETKSYDNLDYYIIELPDLFPIACSSLISPFVSVKGYDINNHTNPDIPWTPIMLTVLPDFTQTIIILACFPEDKNGVLFLDELAELSEFKLKKVLSSILIFLTENTFFSPSLWNKLGEKNQRKLCDDLTKGIVTGLEYMPKKFEYSQINFFDERFSYTNLKKTT